MTRIILGLFWDHSEIILVSFWDHFGMTLGSFWDDFGIIFRSFWDHSLTLRVVAVDPNTLQPCVAVTGTKLPREKKPRAEQDFGDCGGHHNGGGGGDGGGGDGYGRRFAPSADGASRRRLGVGLRGVVSGTPSPNLVIESMSLRWVV